MWKAFGAKISSVLGILSRMVDQGTFFGADSVAFSCKRVDWGTPKKLFREWDDRFHFTLDVCATPENALVGTFFTEEDNALLKDWEGKICWMNPPYGRAIKLWVAKAYQESLKGATVVALIPARTDTSYWHQYIFPFADIHFLKGRVQFVLDGMKPKDAPFPSAIVVWPKKSPG